MVSGGAPRSKPPCNRDYSSEQSAAPLANSGRSRCQTAKRQSVTLHARSKRVREHLESLQPLPHARSIVRAHGRARVMRPPWLLCGRAELSAPRLRVRRRAKREDGVICWWSDNDRARANDWRPRRIVREDPRQQIGALACGIVAGHFGSLLPFGGGFSARRRLVRLSRIASGLLPMRQATRFHAHKASLDRSLERPNIGGAERGYGCA